jgi:hypothetical protein
MVLLVYLRLDLAIESTQITIVVRDLHGQLPDACGKSLGKPTPVHGLAI